MLPRSPALIRTAVWACVVSTASFAAGQPTPTASATKSEAPSGDSSQVVIKRDALRIVDAKTYQVPLRLQPLRQITITAPVTAVVQRVPVKPGEKVSAQAELLRFDNAEQQLQLQRASALFRVAQVELKLAGGTKEEELAQAKLEAARAELELAQLRLDRATIRAPFAGELFRVHVVEGQLLRAGEPIATIGDTSQLTVELPVDRKSASVGSTVPLLVEHTRVEAKVQALLPADERFEPLRGVVESLATAVVHLDNANNAYTAGQTVWPTLVPRHPVAEVQNAALQNLPEGQRKVQVIRQGIVRDVQVETLGQVGTDRVFVSGPFSDGDELVVTTSRELADGAIVRPIAATAATTGGSGRTGSTPSRAGSVTAPAGNSGTKKPGF